MLFSAESESLLNQGQQASAKQAAEGVHAANVRANAARLAEEGEPASPKRIADDDQASHTAEPSDWHWQCQSMVRFEQRAYNVAQRI